MSSSSRRVFLLQVTQLAVAGPVLAQGTAAPKVDEKDPQAVALGYVADSSKVNTTKYPKHTKDQVCASCALFQGKAGEAFALCPIFSGRQVAAKGWCSTWVKKP